ncbi:hypothetical protein ACFY00_36185 [Kitasatospora sp. NPDC001540]|uniref:hypothetical protein n=1 Tax=Kitasatospora sp. NPDC001540 TaxID=3364014 RepID=UPI00368F815F
MYGRRWWWAAAAVAVVLGAAVGCSEGGDGSGAARKAGDAAATDAATGGTASGGTASGGTGGGGVGGRAPQVLRDGLLTKLRLPVGFTLNTNEVESTTTRAPGGPTRPSPEPLASMPCDDIGVSAFVTRHAPPLEDVAVGLQRSPAEDDVEDLGWFGQESLDRYPPGRAARVIAELRAAALRCAGPVARGDGSDRTERTVTAEPLDVGPLGGGLLLRTADRSDHLGLTWVDRTVVLPVGDDVLLIIQEVVSEQESPDLLRAAGAAVAAYRSALAG